MWFFWVVVAAYLVAQGLVIWRARRWWRLLAALPVVVMGPLIVGTYRSMSEGDNLGPMFFVLIAPFALGIVTWVMLRQDARAETQVRQQIPESP